MATPTVNPPVNPPQRRAQKQPGRRNRRNTHASAQLRPTALQSPHDPPPAAYHSDISAQFLAKASRYLTEDDLHQASEKGWGAAAQAVKAVAESRGWDHSGHRQLHETVDRLVKETGQPDLRLLFASANILYINFYDGFLSSEAIAAYLEEVHHFTERLRPLLD